MAGTLAGTAATLGCCGLGILGPTAVFVAGSGIAAPTWEYPVVYVSLALALAGLLMNGRRHRRPGPGILGAFAALLLLLALQAWDVAVFAALIGGGSAILGAAVAFDIAAAWRLCRRSLEESG